MSEPIKILALAGSTRSGSFNKKLVAAAASSLSKAGAVVTVIDLKDYPMPLFDEDVEKENGLPKSVRKFKDLLIDHDGFFISTPEYNGFFSGVLKNAIDWASRPVEGYPPYECFEGKVGAVAAASPGSLGGIRALEHIRQQLSNIKVFVIPDQLAISSAGEAFSVDGSLANPGSQKALDKLCVNLIATVKKQ